MKSKLPTAYQEYIYKSRYARYLWSEKRREEWPETVKRYIEFFKKRHPKANIPWQELEDAILNLEVMPSMRAMMTAGPALDRDNVAGYNCAYTAIDNVRVFDEILYVLMCGTGVGFSVERQFISKLPEVAEDFHETEIVIQVRDSRIGWASGFRQLLGLLYQGQVPRWDLSKLRDAGEPLKTFGGRSSGPRPLDELFSFTCSLLRNAAGRKLTSVECHDLVCKIADVVVCGGVRRSALLSLSNLTDERMRAAKTGEWWNSNPQRALANNSVCYTEKPDIGVFMKEWQSLYQSKSGERGLFSREACKKAIPERRDPEHEFGTNPCSEIILRNKQFCNLSEVVLRRNDSQADRLRKVQLATILGTLQATLVDFRYLSKGWRDNTKEERLLGVSLTGIYDCFGITRSDLQAMRDVAIDTNKIYAKRLKIPASTAITCVKPSGTVSQLVNSSSGIHPRYSPYYIRRVKADKKDPLAQVLIDQGVPYEEGALNPHEWVFSFPIKSPKDSVCVKDFNALEQLREWQVYQDNWCEHKPSVSIYVKEHEWLEVGAWVYKNFDYMSGVSFFPLDGHVYTQAPYEEITEEKYEELVKSCPSNISLEFVENYDTTTSSQEIACVGGACEL